MRSPESLRNWIRRILPGQSPCSQGAAQDLLHAWCRSFTTNLTELARHAGRETSTRVARQFFHRWLGRPHWEPILLYAALPELLQQPWKGRGPLPLLIDFTHLGGGGAGWSVLQASVPWQGRALPVYRLVQPRSHPDTPQLALVLQLCEGLATLLPGRRGRYVLVMDRGFPGHELLNELRARGWRFVIRVPGEWTMRHPRYTGRLRDAHLAGRVGAQPQWFGQTQLGWRETGPQAHRHSSQAHVVWYHGPGFKEPWFLLTSERRAARTVALYRQRMQIEAEFRDLKGPWGLDGLVTWTDRDAVARFLAWVAVYEWRLALLWWVHRLARLASDFTAYGQLSWIHVTRAWIARQLQIPKEMALARL